MTGQGHTVGVFHTRDAADKAVTELRSAGWKDDQIGMVGKDTKAAEGATIGAAAGAATAAAVGAGIMAGVIPVIGPVLAMGPLAVTLLNAAGGAAVAGLAGALVGAGIPDEDAKYYEGEVNKGRYIVTTNAGDRGADVRNVYTRYGGYDRSTAPRT